MSYFDENSSISYISEEQKALIDGKSFVESLSISEISEAIKKNPVIHVFYEWDTLPTAIDIESKFTQAGIANVILHEKRIFLMVVLIYCLI